jgi:hypothetical protein
VPNEHLKTVDEALCYSVALGLSSSESFVCSRLLNVFSCARFWGSIENSGPQVRATVLYQRFFVVRYMSISIFVAILNIHAIISLFPTFFVTTISLLSLLFSA